MMHIQIGWININHQRNQALKISTKNPRAVVFLKSLKRGRFGILIWQNRSKSREPDLWSSYGKRVFSKIIPYSRQQKNISHLRKKRTNQWKVIDSKVPAGCWEGISEFSWSIGGSSYMETFYIIYVGIGSMDFRWNFQVNLEWQSIKWLEFES